MNHPAAAAALDQFFSALHAQAWEYLLAITTLGTLVMAIIETLKNVTPIRQWWQRLYLRSWLARRALLAPTGSNGDKEDPFSVAPNSQRAIADLIKLATAGEPDAFYNLPIDQMCGQANSAVQAVMDYPDEYPDLLRCLAPLAELADLRAVISQPPQPNPVPTGIAALLEARAHVNTQVQRSLDAFQITAGYQWQRGLKLLSFALSFVLTFSALTFFSSGTDGSGHSFLKASVLSLASGFLAPFARDLMAAVQGLRP